MTAKRILVVDDEDTVREIVALCLQRLGGWEALTVASGQEALQQAQANPPDAIVLDVMMPEMDGFTFLQYLRAEATLRSISPCITHRAKSPPPSAALFRTGNCARRDQAIFADQIYSGNCLSLGLAR